MYQGFINENVAPRMATKIGVYNSSNEKVGKVELGNLNRITGEKLYSFGVLSDVHNQSNQTSENDADLQRALTYFNNNQNVVMTCICGDITQGGSVSELQRYKNNVDTYSPNTPVYTTTGNHDCTTNGLDLANWQTYTGQNRCFEITYGNDKFLFLGMNKWSLGTSGIPYLDSDIDWLEAKLEEYRNQRVFIFTHLFFPSRAGNYKNYYPSSNWLGGNQLTRLEGLCDYYKNTVWFSGHSHWKWYLQEEEEENANIYRNNSGWCVHVPSCASPRVPSGTSQGVYDEPASEGAVVDVYANFIVIRGMDLKNTKYLPVAQYKLDTSLIDIEVKPISTYSITNNLTNCTNSNNATTVEENNSYNATITAIEGYELSSVTVTMGGVVQSVTGGNISIANVTGNIVITAIATEVIVNTDSTIDNISYLINTKLDKSNGTESTDNAYTASKFIIFDNSKTYKLKSNLTSFTFGASTVNNDNWQVSVVHFNANKVAIGYSADIIGNKSQKFEANIPAIANTAFIRLRIYNYSTTYSSTVSDSLSIVEV